MCLPYHCHGDGLPLAHLEAVIFHYILASGSIWQLQDRKARNSHSVEVSMSLMISVKRSGAGCMVLRSLLYVFAVVGLFAAGTSDVSAQYQIRKPSGPTSTASITVTSPAGGETWGKSGRHEIRWESDGVRGSVKIELVGSQGKAFTLIRQTLNNGKYSFSVPRTVKPGDYKVRITSSDGKVTGESAAFVHIVTKPGPGPSITKPKPIKTGEGSKGETSKPTTRVTKPSTLKPGWKPGTTKPTGETKPEDTPTPATGGSTDRPTTPKTAVVRGTEPSVDVAAQVRPSDIQVVRHEFTPVRVSVSELETVQAMNPIVDFAVKPSVSELRPMNIDGEIEVTNPTFDAVWEAGNQYPIRWTSSDITGDVKIDLVRVPSPTVEEVYPVVASTANDGAFDYRVPYRMGCKPFHFYLRVATPSEQVKDYSPLFEVYTEPVDMACRVMDMKQASQTDYYVVYVEKDEWLEFDVWLRNNGTLRPVTVQMVSVILIKEPEELVVAQEEWGFSGIYPHLWYKTPEPRKFDISSKWAAPLHVDEDIDLSSGAYRLEVEIDPQNRLGENPALRADNRVVKRFHIR